MEKALYSLFVLTMGASFAGLMASGFSLVTSLMLFGPIAIAVFTALAFIYLLAAVMFEKSDADIVPAQDYDEKWLTSPALQHSNS